MNTERLMSLIRSADPGKYDCCPSDIIAISEANCGELIAVGAGCFSYGFQQGQRAAKAEARRKEKERFQREMENHAPGYGLLWALVQKNMGNERFVRCVVRFAQRMDGRSQEERT